MNARPYELITLDGEPEQLGSLSLAVVSLIVGIASAAAGIVSTVVPAVQAKRQAGQAAALQAQQAQFAQQQAIMQAQIQADADIEMARQAAASRESTAQVELQKLLNNAGTNKTAIIAGAAIVGVIVLWKLKRRGAK